MSAYHRMNEDGVEARVEAPASTDVPDAHLVTTAGSLQPVIIPHGVPAQPVQINPGPPTNILKDYKNKVAFVCGIMQLVLGALAVILGIVSLAFRIPAFEVGMGIWAGVCFIVTGSFGVVSSRTKSRCSIVTCMVLSIISSVFAGIMTMTYINLLVHAVGPRSYPYWVEHGHRYVMPIVYGGSLLAGFTELIVSVVQSAMCCRVTCCGSPAPDVRVLYLPYTPRDGQQYSEQEGNVTFFGTTGATSGNQPMSPQASQTVSQGCVFTADVAPFDTEKHTL